jgi:hypothetical protein
LVPQRGGRPVSVDDCGGLGKLLLDSIQHLVKRRPVQQDGAHAGSAKVVLGIVLAQNVAIGRSIEYVLEKRVEEAWFGYPERALDLLDVSALVPRNLQLLL